jgi:hypothetical protein
MSTQFKIRAVPEFDEDGYCLKCGHTGTLAPGIDLFCELCPSPGLSGLLNYIDPEATKLSNLADTFGKVMHDKMLKSYREKGRRGWDDPAWTIDQIKTAMIEHIEKGDPIDLAVFAAFWWNKLQSD